MTDLATALAARQLTDFEGVEVIKAACEMPNAAGGLQEAMDFEPVELHHAAEGYMVIHFEVAKIRFDPVKDSDGLKRVHVLKALQVVLVDESDVKTLLEGQRDKIRKLREEAAGIQRIAFDEDLAEQETAALTEEAEQTGGEDADGYYDPAIVAEGATTHEIGSAPKRARAPRKPKAADE